MASRNWNKWRWLWVGWLALFVVFQAIAVWNTEDDDTFSEFIWDFVVTHPIGWFGVAGLLAWLAYHFLVQKDSDEGDDDE